MENRSLLAEIKIDVGGREGVVASGAMKKNAVDSGGIDHDGVAGLFTAHDHHPFGQTGCSHEFEHDRVREHHRLPWPSRWF